ncbi:hypothetical protein bAD24_III03755 [Burkholderia sp. AD24]|nr:hypothetical protein bAD24_III03755 [Burkholderia sp. AD24]
MPGALADALLGTAGGRATRDTASLKVTLFKSATLP